MKPIDINNVNKVSNDTQIGVKSKSKIKTNNKFGEIFEKELEALKNEKTTKSGNIMQTSQLLNIQHLSNENIFAEKGLKLCNEINNILDKISANLKDDKNIKELISKLNLSLQNLSKISEHVDNNDVKNTIDRTIFISNIEIEKYIRGDYS